MISVGKQGQKDLKTSQNIKSREGSGMKTDQAQQMDAFLNQSAKTLNKS